MQSWLEGRIWVGKGAQQQGWPQAWEYSQAKLIQTLVRASQGVNRSWNQCIKSHHAQTSSGKGLPSHFWTRDNVRSVLPGLWRKRTQWSKVLFSDEVNFAFHLEIKVPESGGSGEAQNPCCLKSSVKFPQSVMIWAAMSLLVLVQCFLKSTVNAAIYQEILEHFHAFFCWQALWRCWFHFPAGLGTCPHCQRYRKLVQWPWCYCDWLASKLAWPEPHRESMGYCQEEDDRHQTQQCRWAEGHCQRNLGFHTTSAVPQTDHLHATPKWGSN